MIGLTLTGAGSAGVSGTSAGSVRMLISMTLNPRSMGSVRRRPRFVQTLIDKSVILKHVCQQRFYPLETNACTFSSLNEPSKFFSTLSLVEDSLSSKSCSKLDSYLT